MRLAEFILSHREAILADWETFAATLLPAAQGMTRLSLRDHAPQILAAVAKDLSQPQTRAEQHEKSLGRAPVLAGAPETAAQTHAVLRAQSGFDIIQLVAEYRALRASVLRLWIDAAPLDQPGVYEVVRFNEAIDQAVAESVSHFHAEVERARNLLLAMLGHDMRSPLNTMLMTASYLSALNAGERVSVAAARLLRSGASLRALLDDLTEFNRATLGRSLKVTPADGDLGAAVTDELEQLRGAHPGRRIELAANGDGRGRWDAARVQQLVRNLVSNAIQHGSPDQPVRVALRGEEADVHLEVTNRGPEIAPSALDQIFEPLRRGPGQGDGHDPRRGLGLGLFIVREIVKAHGGEVQVRSAGGETTFAVRLPRQTLHS
ncbi:MAG: sensor histidine kinase [Planctomycetes bacterium]|nr:sensor histidine kinase [Planctomycetota bacterium]